jgi:epoxyqueuosine reductase
VLTSKQIKERATHLGFDLCGIAPAGDFTELRALPGWLQRGFAGRMTYLNRTAKKRADVRQWLPSARSVVSVACVYHTDRPLSVEARDPGEALIARYAWGDDYHDVLQRRLEALLAWMRAASGEPFDARIGVDDAPAQERVYAAHAGLGWIGKNTCVINPAVGSWFVLGEIVTSLSLAPDEPVLDHCGTCRLCLDACPTGAIVEPYVLDATRCISYLTIEIKKSIPDVQRPDLGAHVFGCDICQDVCPWNATSAPSEDPAWAPREGLDRPRLADLWRDTDGGLAARIDGTALRRRGVAGLRRNVVVALGNSGAADAGPALAASLRDAPAAADPVVAQHREWAAARLSHPPLPPARS